MFAVLGLVAILVVAGVIAIVVTANRDDAPAKEKPAAASGDSKLAAERDAAIKAGSTVAATFNTLDHTDAEADLARWEALATGDLLTELRGNHDQFVQQVTAARTTSVGKVLAAGLAELDTTNGTARLLVAVSTEVTTAGGEPTKKQLRMSITLKKTKNSWLANAVTQI